MQDVCLTNGTTVDSEVIFEDCSFLGSNFCRSKVPQAVNEHRYWLVVWLPFFIFPYELGIVIPIDFHIFRGVQTTNQDMFLCSRFFRWDGLEGWVYRKGRSSTVSQSLCWPFQRISTKLRFYQLISINLSPSTVSSSTYLYQTSLPQLPSISSSLSTTVSITFNAVIPDTLLPAPRLAPFRRGAVERLTPASLPSEFSNQRPNNTKLNKNHESCPNPIPIIPFISYIYIYWLVVNGCHEFGIFPSWLGMSSSQLTFLFFRGVA